LVKDKHQIRPYSEQVMTFALAAFLSELIVRNRKESSSLWAMLWLLL